MSVSHLLNVKGNNEESPCVSDLPQGCSYVLRSFTMTATLTAMPTLSSEFQRTPADKKHFSRSTESACEGRSPCLDAGRETAKKARVKGTFLQAFLCACAFRVASIRMQSVMLYGLEWGLRAPLTAMRAHHHFFDTRDIPYLGIYIVPHKWSVPLFVLAR